MKSQMGTRTEASNPTRPTESSVQIRKKNKKYPSINESVKTEHKKSTEIYNNFDNREDVKVVVTMRDLYNRKEKLQYWINRVNADLHGTDQSDVLKLIQFMQDKERAPLWLVRCITALI
jgi:hypothetical protein